MTRLDELKELLKDADLATKTTALPLLTEMVFLEEQLDSLRKLPFIKVHPKYPDVQKATPAAKQYKELLQQYTNIIKVISRTTGDDAEGEESPLRKWVNSRANQGTKDLDA